MGKNYLKLLVVLVFATNVMAQNVPSYVPSNGLIFWLPFNNSCIDESENKLNIEYNDIEYVSDRNNNVNSAILMNGLNSKINLVKPIILNGNQRRKYTISFWINTNYEETKVILSGAVRYSKYDSDPYTKFETINSIQFQIKNRPYEDSTLFGMAMYEQTIIKNASSKEKWQNITIVKNENNLSFYVDGKFNYTSTLDTFEIKNANYNYYGINQTISKDDFFINLIGAHELYNPSTKSTEYSTFYKGLLDDIAIYNRALTDQEVKQLYEGCTKETATSSSFNSVIYTTNTPVNLSANPTGGTFNGEAVANNSFNPSKAKLGKNQVKYNFKNSTGCADSTNFTMILVDTLGNKCSTYDTLKIKVQLTTGMKAGQIATMNVYPNPTSDVVIIEANDVAALNGYSYKMVDLQGKQVYKELVTTSKTEISLKSIGAKGVYILHIVDAQGVSIENKKIVLE